MGPACCQAKNLEDNKKERSLTPFGDDSYGKNKESIELSSGEVTN